MRRKRRMAEIQHPIAIGKEVAAAQRQADPLQPANWVLGNVAGFDSSTGQVQKPFVFLFCAIAPNTVG